MKEKRGRMAAGVGTRDVQREHGCKEEGAVAGAGLREKTREMRREKRGEKRGEGEGSSESDSDSDYTYGYDSLPGPAAIAKRLLGITPGALGLAPHECTCVAVDVAAGRGGTAGSGVCVCVCVCVLA